MKPSPAPVGRSWPGQPAPRRGGMGWYGLGLALAVHAGLMGWLFLGAPPVPQREKPRMATRIRIAPPPKAPAASGPPSEPMAPETSKAPRVERAPARKLPKAPAPETAKPADPPKLADAPPPREAPRPQARKFTVAMDATTSAGTGLAGPASGNATSWAYGGAEGEVDGDEVLIAAPGRGGVVRVRPADTSELTTWPRLVTQPSGEEMRALYPEAARRESQEGNVALKILVSTTGEVLKVKLVKSAGAGFDEAAQELVKRFRFRAGERGGEPVAVWIPWTYKFRLDG